MSSRAILNGTIGQANDRKYGVSYFYREIDGYISKIIAKQCSYHVP